MGCLDLKLEPIGAQNPRDSILRLVDAGRAANESDVYFGKRDWTRHVLQMKLDVTTDPDDPAARLIAIVHNVSGGGVGMWVKRPFAPDAEIYLRAYTPNGYGPWIPARVAHCTLGIQGYLVGAKFCEPLEREAELPGKDQAGATYSRSSREDPGSRPYGPRSPLSQQPLGKRYGRVSAISACVAIAIAGWFCLSSRPHEWPAWITAAAILVVGTISPLAGWLVIRQGIRSLNEAATATGSLIRGERVGPMLSNLAGRESSRLREALLDLETMLRTREEHDRAHREKLEELNRVKSNFLSIVSHDLRTPLTSILLYARMLMDQGQDLNDTEQQRFLTIIADECTRLSRLVDDLLEVQRLEADRAEWKIEPADLVQVIHTSVGVFEAMAQSKSIQLSVDCPDSLPAVAMDSERISQVISNLLSNALKYTPVGGAVRITAEPSGRDVLVRVKDTGPGIPRDKWDQIFDRFCQLSDTNVSEFGGVGLGLYIVKWIVERHGGAVWVDSEVGKGSEFCFSLATCSQAPNKHKADAAELTHRAVVCDMAPEVVAMISQMLRGKDFEVRPAHSAQRLLAHLNEWEPELVVTDLRLPDMDAPQLLQRITSHPRRRSFHLIVHSHVNAATPVKVPGVDILLLRPVCKDDLLQAVDFTRRRRSPDGRVVLFVGAPDEGMDRLFHLVNEAGHTAILAADPGEAFLSIQRYPVERILVFDACLGETWSEVNLLRLEGSRASITVLSQVAGSREQALAEIWGVPLIQYSPGNEEHVVEAILHQAADVSEVLTA